MPDLGAAVTKIETPHGDCTRTWARSGAQSAIFHVLNRGKCVSLAVATRRIQLGYDVLNCPYRAASTAACSAASALSLFR
jgi:CoA-transferase family III